MMQTAAEFVESMIPSYHNMALYEGYPRYDDELAAVIEYQEDRDREVRLDEHIKTLREAARLVCYKCNNGTPVEHVKIDWYHLSVIGQPQACMAASLHDRVAELEAERAGTPQEKNSPCAEQKNS